MNGSPSSSSLTVENPQRDIRLAAMNLLARREYAYQELLTKLSQKFSKSEHHPQSMIEAQLQRLQDEGLQSDVRFVEAFINSKINSGKGPLLIRQQLQQKGVAADLVALGLEAVEEQWFDLAQQLYERKYRDRPLVELKERAKRMRFMASRGFMSHHFQHLLELEA